MIDLRNEQPITLAAAAKSSTYAARPTNFHIRRVPVDC